MKRIAEKVKDIVELRPYVGLHDYFGEPELTVGGYHFTDITSNLMSKWLTRYSEVTPQSGATLALAGFRGVGKSHFLAAFGSILSRPELRSKLTDSYVISASQKVPRRPIRVAWLQRGVKKSLIEELKAALAPIIGSEPGALSDSLNEILLLATRSAGDTPLVILVDTADERVARVARDDGAVLTEIAAIAKTLGIMVVVALDDDISGADGANFGISQSFSIDYLDQEHLYKIVDGHIFPKRTQMLPVLRDIYHYYQGIVPGFRWSEERFNALYPLHPAIMEIAPYVRLYMQDFALLTFASEAGTRILGRPANSLIAPDEVFDRVEKNLRNIDALKNAFSAYDSINTSIISKIPVMKRLQAKLLLKGLMLFSLNGEGATAADLGASMLIFDENEPESTVQYVDELLTTFADAAPSQISVNSDSGGSSRFSLPLDGKDGFRSELIASASRLPYDVVNDLLTRMMDDRFSDCSIAGSTAATTGNTECSIEWRGGIRKGVVYLAGNRSDLDPFSKAQKIDWTAAVTLPGEVVSSELHGPNAPLVLWNTAELHAEEIDTLLRFQALQTDVSLRAQFQGHLAAALQTHSTAVDTIFQRVMLDEAVLSIEGFEYNFTDEARNAQSLSQIFTLMLEPHFEGRFPMHPYFQRTITMAAVSDLVVGLFGGMGSDSETVQSLAAAFAVPTGVAAAGPNGVLPVDVETLSQLPLAQTVLERINRSSGGISSLEDLSDELCKAPFGLVEEASCLLLSAMVAARQLEFVTSNGDRISHRSLDLKLVWEDIVGVALAADVDYSDSRLVSWARQLTEISALRSLKTPENREAVVDALADWLSAWKSNNIPGKFDKIPDVDLNTKVWRLAASAIKPFRGTAEIVALIVDGSLALEAGLERVAETFADSDEEFTRRRLELQKLEDLILESSLTAEISTWLSFTDVTGEKQIDLLRQELYRGVSDAIRNPGRSLSTGLKSTWMRFREDYSEHYRTRHDGVAGSPHLKEKLAEICKTDLWWEFENLSSLGGLDHKFRAETRRYISMLRQMPCREDIGHRLLDKPFCSCGFFLAGSSDMETLPELLWKTVHSALADYRSQLRVAVSDPSAVNRESNKLELKNIVSNLDRDDEFRRLTDEELGVIRDAFSQASPFTNGLTTSTRKRRAADLDVDQQVNMSGLEDLRLEELVELTAN